MLNNRAANEAVFVLLMLGLKGAALHKTVKVAI